MPPLLEMLFPPESGFPLRYPAYSAVSKLLPHFTETVLSGSRAPAVGNGARIDDQRARERRPDR